jgi:hypothetical protein
LRRAFRNTANLVLCRDPESELASGDVRSATSLGRRALNVPPHAPLIKRLRFPIDV